MADAYLSSAPKVSISDDDAAKRLNRVVRPVDEAGAIEFGGDAGVDCDPDCRRVLVVNLVEDVGVEALLDKLDDRCAHLIGITEACDGVHAEFLVPHLGVERDDAHTAQVGQLLRG